MTENDVKVKCHRLDCYWNIGAGFNENCANKYIELSGNSKCLTFIDRDKALEALSKAASKSTKGGYDMSKSGIKTLRGIDPEFWHQLRVQTMKERKTIGEYLNQLITNDIKRKESK